MLNKILIIFLVLVTLELVVAPPVDQQKKDEEKKAKQEEIDDFGLEYGRYLQQVVQALEEDKEFAKKLENISAEQIRTGHIAKELEFVKHNVRSKLDELKRIEVDRLRKLIQEQMERTELGINRKGVKIPKHLDVENPHTFEIADLKKLIQTASNDLEELDKKRREEFKQYELDKEAKYREGLSNMTDDQRKEAVQHHDEMLQKHKDHPKVSHPGSKPQLEQVWEERDHMPKEEFNPKTFFAMHDVNGDGHLDVDEVEAILIPEVKKLYDPNNEEDDPAEMAEEFHRMREHIFNETDSNRDYLISLEEFLKMTERQEFQRDEGWKGLDEQPVYNEAELEEYMRQRHMQYYPQGNYYGQQDPRNYYDVGAQHGMPPPGGYQVHPGGIPQHPSYQQAAPMHGVPPQGYQQRYPEAGHQQGYPQAGHQQGYPQAGHQQGYPQAGHQQGYPQAGHQQGYPQEGHQQGYPQAGGHQQAFPQAGHQQGYPQAGYQQGVPVQGMPPQQGQFQQGYAQQGHEQSQPQPHPPQQQSQHSPPQQPGTVNAQTAVPPNPSVGQHQANVIKNEAPAVVQPAEKKSDSHQAPLGQQPSPKTV